MAADKIPTPTTTMLRYRFPMPGFDGETSVLTADGKVVEQPQHVEYHPAPRRGVSTLLYIESTATDGAITRHVLQCNSKGVLRLVPVNAVE
jgi:hypothetical protein